MREKILVGGYTKRESKGIYSFDLDIAKEELSNLTEVAHIQNATYFALDKAKQHLYTCAADENGGGIAALSYKRGKTELLNSVTSVGAPLCYLAVDNERGFVYGANYHLGEIRVYKIQKNGSLTLTDTVKHEGEGSKVHPGQERPHVHYTDLTPDGRLVTCDLGTDEITVYDVVGEEGKLSLVSLYRMPAGTGVRHLTFHPNGKIAYAIGEFSSTVTVLSYNEEKGRFAALETISTLPVDFEGTKSASALRLSSDGAFLYASNRGHNSIAIYSVSPLGTKITLEDIVKTEGETPRDFNFNSTEDFIIVAHQDSDNISLFRRNRKTGMLTLKQKDFYSPEGTCILPTL